MGKPDVEAEKARIRKALDKMGMIIEDFGLSYAPIFLRLEAELAAREHRAPSVRAREMLKQLGRV
jgi:hypothetical protein